MLSSARSSSNATGIVDSISLVEALAGQRLNGNRLATTTNTARVKKEKQDIAIMRETLDQSLGSFKVT